MLKVKFLFALAMVFLLSGICFSAGPGGEGNFYISKKYDAPGWDGNIKQWTIAVEYLALIKTDGTVVPVMTSSKSVNLLDANAGEIAGHFKEGASIPTGSYKQVRIRQGATTKMKGWIHTPGDFLRTRNGDPNWVDAANEVAAEATAEEITIVHGDGGVEDDVPENPDPSQPVIVREGNSYELRIIWTATGLESGNGVGLVFNFLAIKFLEGMLCEQFILHNNTDGTDQYFTGIDVV